MEYKVDKETLGKVGSINKAIYDCKDLINAIEKIEKEDNKRSMGVLYFFNGYYNVICNVANNLANDGKLCFVVGNRTVKGHQIQMDQITASFLESFAFQFEHIFVRTIHNKIMPSQNLP